VPARATGNKDRVAACWGDQPLSTASGVSALTLAELFPVLAESPPEPPPQAVSPPASNRLVSRVAKECLKVVNIRTADD
jgi:hypothetical protein